MKKIEPKYCGENKGHYAAGIISNGMLYISGQLSMDPDTRKLPDGGIEAHSKLALENVDRVLKEAELCRHDVVQCRVYVSDIDQWDVVNQIYAEFFGEHKPVRTVVPVGKLHFGCLVEIEAIAEVNQK
ncbi:RidA family protein [Paenibacillus kribbensis]|uniref:RidA family protein n=1 Tax=Paenibacillus TaxID=44249 RepID=UPI00024EFB66|nr:MULTISPECIES: RidA family protein [Paenibacillus]EHS56037.1 translation initiation inhibitor [Paenibacillus sp. Aloe-11]MEC0237576.1 RidA family protein [Paenibacillus kribbensis]